MRNKNPKEPTIVHFWPPIVNVNRCSIILNTDEVQLKTSGLGGCVAVLTYNPSDERASLAHLMIDGDILQSYKEWFTQETELHTDGVIVALIGGCNERLEGELEINSSRKLVDNLKEFFSKQNFPISFEDLYCEEGKRADRSLCIQRGGVVHIVKTEHELRVDGFPEITGTVTKENINLVEQYNALAEAGFAPPLKGGAANLNTTEELRAFTRLMSQVKEDGVKVIWDQIKGNISDQMFDEFKSTYPAFTGLITAGLYTELPDLDTFQEKIHSPKDYHQNCSPMLCHSGMFNIAKIYAEYLSEHRHDSPEAQREYDQQFGIVLKK